MLRPVSPSGSSAAWTSAPTAPSPSWITGMGSFTGLPPPASCAILSDTGVRDRGSSSRPPVSRSAWRRSRAGRHQDATDYGLEPGRKVRGSTSVTNGMPIDLIRRGPAPILGIMTFAPGSRASASFGPVTMGRSGHDGSGHRSLPRSAEGGLRDRRHLRYVPAGALTRRAARCSAGRFIESAKSVPMGARGEAGSARISGRGSGPPRKWTRSSGDSPPAPEEAGRTPKEGQAR